MNAVERLDGDHEITLVVSRVKREHVAHTLRVLDAATDELKLDRTDIGLHFSVEHERDGVERWIDYIDDDGDIIGEGSL